MMAIAQRSSGVHVACVLTPDKATAHPFVTRVRNSGVAVSTIVVGRRAYYAEYKSLLTLANALSPRIIHTHGYRSDIVGGLAARRAGVPTVSTAHGFVGGSLRNRVNEAIQCLALGRADAVIAVSSPLVERLAANGVPREKIHLVRNGFDPGDAGQTRASARRALGLDDKAKVVGWLGRLSSEKGPDVMLDALALTGDAWQLSMIGDGPELESLRTQAAALGISHRVKWHGAVPNAGSLLAAFDAFALSSRTEGTPIVLFEAMHAGIPIVATAVGGVPDVVGENEALLIPPEAPERLARALDALGDDPESAARRSRASVAKVRESFDVASWMAKVEAVYRTAVEARHRP